MIDMVAKTIIAIALNDRFVPVQSCAHGSIADRMDLHLEARCVELSDVVRKLIGSYDRSGRFFGIRKTINQRRGK